MTLTNPMPGNTPGLSDCPIATVRSFDTALQGHSGTNADDTQPESGAGMNRGRICEVAPNTPILRLAKRFWEINEALSLHPRAVDDDELDRLFYNERDAVEAEIVAIPSTCAADFAAKMLIAHLDGEFSCLFETDPVWVEARMLVGWPLV